MNKPQSTELSNEPPRHHWRYFVRFITALIIVLSVVNVLAARDPPVPMAVQIIVGLLGLAFGGIYWRICRLPQTHKAPQTAHLVQDEVENLQSAEQDEVIRASLPKRE